MSSSRYQHQFKIPEQFPALLKDFTREILRAQVNYHVWSITFHPAVMRRRSRSHVRKRSVACSQGTSSRLARDISQRNGMKQAQPKPCQKQIVYLLPHQIHL